MSGVVSDWVNREKTPARTTTRLLQLIQNTEGGSEPNIGALRRGFGRFPVVGYVWYQDDYGAPRYFPYFHPHAGTDLFAVSGTPVIASVDGFIWKMRDGGTGGTAIWLMTDTGAYYYYGHLHSVAPGIRVGMRVRIGDHIAYVGASGTSAAGTYPHVHFEIHPSGTTDSVNPKPILDAWLLQAESRALGVLGIIPARDALAPTGAARWSALFDFFAEPGTQLPALWTAGFDASGSTIAYADLALANLLAGTDLGSLGPMGRGASGDLSGFEPVDPIALLLGETAGHDHGSE